MALYRYRLNNLTTRSQGWNGYLWSRRGSSCILLFENNAAGTAPGAALLQGTCLQLPEAACACATALAHSQILGERWVCTERLRCRSLGLISWAVSAAQALLLLQKALGLTELPSPRRAAGEPAASTDSLEKKDLMGQHSVKSSRGRTPRQAPPASVFSQFALLFCVSLC